MEVRMTRLHVTGTRGRKVTVAAMTAALVGASAMTIAGCAEDRSAESFCQQLRAVQDLDEVLATGNAARTGEQAGELQQLQRVSPEEIEPHVARLATVTDDLAQAMRTTPDADTAANEVFARRRDELPEITAAGRSVEEYAVQHCAVVLNPTALPDAAAPRDPSAAVPTTTRRG
jgi:hypothetical protein